MRTVRWKDRPAEAIKTASRCGQNYFEIMNMKVRNEKSNLRLCSTSFVIVDGVSAATRYDVDLDILSSDIVTYNESEQWRWLKTTSLILE